MNNYNQLANRINKHVQMLEAQGVTDPHILFNQMMGYIPELNVLWNDTSDQELFELSERYPFFKKYCVIVETLYQQEQQRSNKSYEGLQSFTHAQSALVSEVFTKAAEIEHGLLELTTRETGIDKSILLTVEIQYHQWRVAKEDAVRHLMDENVDKRVIDYLQKALDPVEERIDDMLESLQHDSILGDSTDISDY